MYEWVTNKREMEDILWRSFGFYQNERIYSYYYLTHYFVWLINFYITIVIMVNLDEASFTIIAVTKAIATKQGVYIAFFYVFSGLLHGSCTNP